MVDRVHALDEAQQLVAVADLVVVPAHDLHERVGQGDAGLRVGAAGFLLLQINRV